MKSTATFIIILVAIKQTTFAQKQVMPLQQIWAGYVQQTRLTDKWGLWADANIRTRDHFTNDFSTSIARIGVSYFLSENASVTAGYAYGHYFAGNDGKKVAQPEHRPWQQVQWSRKYPKLRLQQRVRLEERFRRKFENAYKLADGYHFNYRLRYNVSAAMPLGKKPFQPHALSLVVNDEVMLNFGKEIVYNTFDQNRLFVGFNYHLSKNSTLQAGYMNTFQQQASGNNYKNIHTLRINLLQNLDVRKKTKSS